MYCFRKQKFIIIKQMFTVRNSTCIILKKIQWNIRNEAKITCIKSTTKNIGKKSLIRKNWHWIKASPFS